MVRGDEIDFDGIWEGYRSRNSITPAQEEEVNAMFEWAYEGSSHIDNIYRPITAGDWAPAQSERPPPREERRPLP